MTYFFNIKLKAGALQYTIFMAVIIALLVFAFISLTFTQQHFKAKTSNFIRVIHNTNLAVNYASTAKIKYNEVAEMQFSEVFKDQTLLIKKHWGIFDLLTVTSTLKKETFTKNVLLGGSLNARPSLYVQDNNQPLVLVGDTRIEGRTFLPEQGAKRGTIAGNSYTGSQLIYGSVSLSKAVLPRLQHREYINRLAQGTIQFENSIPLELTENSTIVNSFNKPVQLFYSMAGINLRLVKLTGNIIIQSNSVIKIGASAKLKDVILIAPKVEISGGVTGNFQIFAAKEIIVGENCKLEYPTALIVCEDKVINTSNQLNISDKWNQILIQSGSEIKGVIGFISENKINNFKPQLLLEENTHITGEVFCNQNIDLRGTVTGSVFTNRFIANQFGSIYQNHIYNGKILSTDFPEQYCGLAMEKSTKRVAKWLY